MSLNLPIYSDNNATTKTDERVFEEMKPYFINNSGNSTSRNHQFGWVAEDAIDISREQIAKL